MQVNMEIEGLEEHDRCFVDLIKREIDSGISFESVLQTAINTTHEQNEKSEIMVTDNLIMKACILMMSAYALAASSKSDEGLGDDDWLEFKIIVK